MSVQPSSTLHYSILTDHPDIFAKRGSTSPIYQSSSGKATFLHLTLTPNEFNALKPFIKSYDVRLTSPQTESFLSDFFPEVNAISAAKQTFPHYFQMEDTLSIKENDPDLEDIDLLSRVHISELSEGKIDRHATDMATIIAGNGNTFYSSLGILPDLHISTSSFNNLFPDPTDYFGTYGISVQNHSYGLNVEDYYGLEANAYDDQVYANPDLVHVFSAGNRGLESGIFSPYASIDQASTLSGTFKHAKNVLAIGAIDSFSQVLEVSSRGPAYDGRIKPELVAYGYAGTSDAAAITSGCAMVIRNALKIEGLPQDFSAVRAALIAGAVDIGLPGPDFSSGFGKVNLLNSLSIVANKDVLTGQISSENPVVFQIEDASDITHVVLSWTDPPADIEAPIALVNDLDIEIVENDGTFHYPILTKYLPEEIQDSTRNTTGRDSVNTIEKIDVANLEDFTIRVIGHKLSTNSQDFSIAIGRAKTKELQFIYPFENANLEPFTRNQVLINGVRADDNVFVEFDENTNYDFPSALIFDGEYEKITGSVMNDEGSFADVNFRVSAIPRIEIAWTCEDSLRFQWEESVIATQTQILKLVGTELQVIDSTFAEFYTIANEPNQFYTVRYKFSDGTTSPHSLILNTSQSNTTCFYQIFSGQVTDQFIELSIKLVHLPPYEVLQVEKKVDGDWKKIDDLPVGILDQKFVDVEPELGLNSYRLTFIKDQEKSYSEVVEVFYLPENEVVVWPTYTTPSVGVDIVQGKFRPLEILLFNTSGQLCKKQALLSAFDFITLEDFSTGLYFYILFDDNKSVKSGKIMVLPE